MPMMKPKKESMIANKKQESYEEGVEHLGNGNFTVGREISFILANARYQGFSFKIIAKKGKEITLKFVKIFSASDGPDD